MKVYVIEEFTDYEGSKIVKVVSTKEKAETIVRRLVEEEEKYWPWGISTIERLPTGWRVRDRGFIWHEFEVE